MNRFFVTVFGQRFRVVAFKTWRELELFIIPLKEEASIRDQNGRKLGNWECWHTGAWIMTVPQHVIANRE